MIKRVIEELNLGDVDYDDDIENLDWKFCVFIFILLIWGILNFWLV